MTLFYRYTFLLLLFISCSTAGFSQPLSGVFPKFDAYEYQSTVNFQWNSMPTAIDYTVVLAQDEAFTINLTQSPAITLTSWTSGPLVYGTWFWKVLGNDGLTITESSTNKFTYFDPSQGSNLSLWLKADAGLTLDINGNVDTWTDLSPNAHQFTQTNSIKRPSITASSLNNLPSLTFTGNHFLNGGDVLDIGTSSRSMFVIGKMGSSNQTMFSKSIAALASSRYGLIKDGVQTAFIYQDVTSPHIYSPINNTNFSLYSIVSNRSTSKNRMEVNNSLLGQITINTTFDMNSTSRFLIGAYNNATNDGELLMLNGGISEIVFINTADSAEILKAENYLRYKYSPPLNLGKDTTQLTFCAISLTAPGGYSNLLWSTGETSLSISVNQAGQYWVQGTDVFGYVSRDTIQVNYPELILPAITGVCINESITWDPQLDPSFTYLWSTGATTPTLNITTAGPYSVQVTDGLGCIKNSGTVNFTIDNYSQTAYLGNDTSLCVGNLIALQVGAPTTVSYLWPDASTGNNYAVDTTGNYFVETVNANGCVAQDTILITIAGQAPVANFSFQDRCNGIANNFVDLSVPLPSDDIAIWEWDLGDGNNSSAQNPNHTYTLPGTYDIELYVESVGGCGAFHTEQVTIHALPTAVIGSVGNCSGQEIQFLNSSTAGSSAITGYFWDFDMPWTGTYNNSVVTVPNRIFDTAGSYDVMMVVTDANSCTDTVYQTVVVNQTPEAAFTAPDVCVGENINFTNTTTNGGASPTYLWDFGDVTFSILAVPTKSYATYGARNITLSVTAANACMDTAVRLIYVNPNPVIDFSFGPHCFGSYMDMNSASAVPEGSIVSNMWIMNNADTVYGDPAYFMIDLMGQNEIELTSTSAVGCSTTDLQFFEVVDTLIASFNMGNGIAAIGDPVQFNNTTIGGGIMLWNFDDGTFSTDFNPLHTYSGVFSDSTLNPYLIAINAAGCKDTAYRTIELATPRLDLELQTIYTQENANSYTVGIKLFNAGTVNITDADLEMWTERGLLFTETWSGLLLPGESFIYVFNGKPNVAVNSEDVGDAFICVEGLGFNANGVAESYLANNKSCKNIEGENVILMPIFPNPVIETMTLQVIVDVASEFTINLYDSRGREIQTIVPTQTLPIGLYSFVVDVQNISNGTYFVRMINGDNERMEKIVISK
jgi:PKD repeat protein